MQKFTSEALSVGDVYTRAQLRALFEIADATLNNGIFRPKGSDSVWLFVTEEKTPDRVQYSDHLDDNVLLMQGQTEGRTDHLILDHVKSGLELLVFHRAKKYEYEGAGFRYEGPFCYVRSFGSHPTSFVLIRDSGRQFTYGEKPSWRWVLEAVQQLGGRATKAQIKDYVVEKFPDFKTANLGPDLSLLAVNGFSRSNWVLNQEPRRSDGWNPYDALFKREDAESGSSYELYDPVKHGVWLLFPDEHGVLRPRLESEPVEAEIERVQNEIQELEGFDVTNDEDGRKKVVASIVRRQGQPKFRKDLLAAYGNRCAVTGCTVVEILEGAHIKPYRGDHTNHVTNGLLLRTDIHTLFDLGLLRINPRSWLIEVAKRAQSTYGQFHSSTLELPTKKVFCPDPAALQQHYDACAPQFVE